MSFVKQWQQALIHLAQPMFALSCMLWEAMDVSTATRGSDNGSRCQRRSKRLDTMLTFLAGWLIFSELMLLPGGISPSFPPHPLYKF